MEKHIPPKLVYTIAFVSDMDRAVTFYRDTLGLTLKFSSPHWSEFVTGETTLALHPASAETVRLEFNVPSLENFCEEMTAKGVAFPMPPKKQDFGCLLAAFVDSEGSVCSVGESGAGWQPVPHWLSRIPWLQRSEHSQGPN